MTQALWGVLLLSLATGAPGSGTHAGATPIDVRSAAELRPVARTSADRPQRMQRMHRDKAAKAAGKMSESYKAVAAE